MFRKTFILLLTAVFVVSCIPPTQNVNSSLEQPVVVQKQPGVVQDPAGPGALAPVALATSQQETVLVGPTHSETESPTATPKSPGQPVVYGPDQFPDSINPLTGLPVANPENLAYSPVLVSITNFPVTARPQAGLSFSPFVFEMYIGEGMTRFLALFYGDFPVIGEDSGIKLDDDRIGPVRSGRLPFENLRQLYHGFLVVASGSANVRSMLGSYTNVWGSDSSDINSALIPATRLEEIAGSNPDRLAEGSLSGLRFDHAVPADGKLARKIWIPFNYLNQVIWEYDENSGAYLRYQDNADGMTFIQATDRLNKLPLTYENVVILFANHDAAAETLINIDLMYINRMPALLFRDGKLHEIYWTTANDTYEKTTGLVRPIRFIDAQGNPFPLKPGQTWVEIVQPYTRYNETVDSQVYIDLKRKQQEGSGVWAIHFYPTVPEK